MAASLVGWMCEASDALLITVAAGCRAAGRANARAHLFMSSTLSAFTLPKFIDRSSVSPFCPNALF